MGIMARNPEGGYDLVYTVLMPDGTYIDRIYDKNGDLVYTAFSSISDVLPITFKTSSGYLKDYRISGNTIQNGTPTPDNPVEVLGCGERTENLFDGDFEQGTISSSGNDSYVLNRIRTPEKIYLSAGSYVFALESMIQCKVFVFLYDEKGTFLRRIPDSWSDLPYVFTIDSSCFVRFCVCYRNESTISPDDVSNIMLTPGATPPDHYIPYGYKIPVTVSGVNLFDKTKEDFVNSRIVLGAAKGVTIAGLVPGNIYTLTSNESEGSISSGANVWFNGGETARYGVWSGKTVSLNALDDGTVTIYIRRSVLPTFFDNYWIMLTHGTTPPSKYEPYREPITTPVYIGGEPLHSLRFYADYVDFKRGVVVRRIKKLVLTGEEELRLQRINPYGVANYRLQVLGRITSSQFIACTHYKRQNKNIADTIDSGLLNVEYIYIRDTSNMTLTDFKSFLSAQYEAGTPVTIWYALTEPEEEPLENLSPIQTIKGTNILTVDTEVQPSEMYIKYRR